MDFRQLGYIAVLAEERHVGRAARRLDMSQPALSVAIKQIEAELGTQLFLRDSRTWKSLARGARLKAGPACCCGSSTRRRPWCRPLRKARKAVARRLRRIDATQGAATDD